MSRRFPRVLAVLVGTVLASMALSSTADATPTASATLTGATLVAKGAAVDVSFVYSCFPGGDFDGLNVDPLTQRVGGGRITSATGAAAVVCDGVQHTVVVRVLAQVLAFRKGVALANWVLTSCEGDQGCIAVPGSDTIRIRAH